MKHLIVRKLPEGHYEASSLPALFDRLGILFEPIECVNWSEDYPYAPKVEFRIAHAENKILLHYRVEEESVASLAERDNGRVWEDSCCEFFSVPVAGGPYYNIECNCTGTLLIGSGAEREGRMLAPEEVMQSVDRWSSLGSQPFEERVGKVKWEMALVVPVSAYFKSQVESLSGQLFKANFYKCGDKLKHPHFLSWNPIHIAKPDFHRPDFFGELCFE